MTASRHRRPYTATNMTKMLGQVVRTLRKQAGVSQVQLATTAGVTPITVIRMELEGRWPTDPSTLDDILRAVAKLSNRDDMQNGAPSVWLMAAQTSDTVTKRAREQRAREQD